MVSVSRHRIDFSSQDLDLRRRRQRELAEFLVERAEVLGEDERSLVLAVYLRGESVSEVALSRGEAARTTGRRLSAVARRMISPRFGYVLANRSSWPRRRASIATICVLQGRTMRDACETLGVTMHVVRTQLGIIDALVSEGVSR